MAMTCLAALIAAMSLAMALFGGVVPPGAIVSEILSLVLAGATGLLVAGFSALDS